LSIALIAKIAEFRGPGIHHNFDDSDSGYDVDMDQKNKPFSANQRGRIILLGDGTEVLTDSDDTEMFDQQEEDKDLASQVHKGQVTGHKDATESDSKAELENSSTAPKYKGVADDVPEKLTGAQVKEENKAPESK
jgi:protein phosphatase 2C family protein 2/3